MYLSRPGQPFAAGHDSAGVTAPATNWFFAEGATGGFFDLFILLANPEQPDAAVRGALPAAEWQRADQDLRRRRQQPLHDLGGPRDIRSAARRGR